jgi:glycosyltransferase involved in cell wall biosynthesis
MMSYIVPSMPSENVEIRLLDTRGRSPKPAMSIFPLVRSWLQLVFLALARKIDVAHINMSSHGSTVRKTAMLWTCRLLRIPTVLHLHSGFYPDFLARSPTIVKALLRRTFSTADVVIVLGSVWQDFVHSELKVPTERIAVLPNGSPGPTSLGAPLARNGAPLKMLFLGRMGRRKGVPEILKALASAHLRDKLWTARLVGDGDLATYRSQAESLGISDRVIFSEWVDTARTQQLLAESDLLLLPSRNEGLPMSVIEAFAYGLSVVSTPVGAIPDILEDGVNGLLVQPGDSAQLADAILTILQDEPLRLRLAESARRTWEEQLDIATYAPKLALCWHRLSAGADAAAALNQLDLRGAQAP